MAEEIAKEVKEPEVKEIKKDTPNNEGLLKDILDRLDKLEVAVYKPNDKPVQMIAKKNYNTDPGPFAKGSGVSTIR